MSKTIEVPADIHEDVDALFAAIDPTADAMVCELLQDRIRAATKLVQKALIAKYNKGYERGNRSGTEYPHREDMGR